MAVDVRGMALFGVAMVVCAHAQTDNGLFTSSSQLQMLLTAERGFVEQLERRVTREQALVDEMKAFQQRISRHLRRTGHSGPVTDPLVAFVNLHRIAETWNGIASDNYHLMRTREDLKSILAKLQTFLPSTRDIRGAADAIFRLQDTYSLDARSLYNRFTKAYRFPLSDTRFAVHHLARQAYTYRDYDKAKMWFDIALPLFRRAVNRTEQNAETALVDVLDHIAFTEYKVGNTMKALVYTKELLRYDPIHVRANENINILEAMISFDPSMQQEDSAAEKNTSEVFDRDKYNSLCRSTSADTQPPSSQLSSQLNCFMANYHPALILKPVPAEVVSKEPYIVVYHEVVDKNDIETVKRLAYKKLSRATVTDHLTGEVVTADYRICKSGWLLDNESQIIVKLNKRLEAITGLTSSTSETLQVGNYGVGGHYEPHFDWSQNFTNSDIRVLGTGDRIATMLLYMSDVEAGGATIFLTPGLAITPKLGSAVFWYNLLRNGSGDETTQHAACPVLYGEKWVANKWFHEVGQEFRRPCSLNPLE